MGQRELCHFPKLQKMLEKNELKDKNERIYCSHLGKMKEDMSTRFKDLSNFVIPEPVFVGLTTGATSFANRINRLRK